MAKKKMTKTKAFFGMIPRLTKKDKKALKTGAVVVGALALVGASANVLKRLK